MLKLTRDKLTGLAEQYGDAFYLLDSLQFKKNFDDLCKEFRSIYPNFNIAYSYKTNYTPKLCKIINSKGGYAEVVSDMEMEIALRCGVGFDKIIWNGPIKNKDKVAELLLNGGTVNIDSVFELDFLRLLAENNPDTVLNLGIRCNFDVGDGVISRFGFDTLSDDFLEAVRLIRETENIHLVNIQCHFAKRNVEFWPARARGMLEVAEKIQSELGYIPDRIDIGGGLFGNMDEFLKSQFSSDIPTYSDYAKAAATIFKESFPDAKPELLIEPGSALVGDCMNFVGRVETIKSVRGKCFITILGSQKNISMTGVNPPIQIVPAAGKQIFCKEADIVGYTCIEGDVLFRNFSGNIAIGDFVVFSNCGSYSLVMKPPFIMPNFPVIDICDNDVELIKEKETFDDIFRTFIF